jgi:hypothetical protein
MMKEILAELFQRELARLRFDYSEEETEIKLLAPLDDIDFGGISIEGGKEGRLLRPPLYLAERLVLDGKAEWTESPYVDISQLYSLLTAEQRQPAIQPLEKYALISIVHQLHTPQTIVDQSSSEFLNSEREKMVAGFRRFLRSRGHKIMRMASQRSHRGLAAKSLTSYELVLFDLITIMIEEWEKALLKSASNEGQPREKTLPPPESSE